MKNFLLSVMVLVFPVINAQSAEIAIQYRARCSECHGADGVSSVSYIPNIGGQKAEYLATQLKDFRDGLRSGSAMPLVVRRMTADDINALADYISSLDRCVP